MLSDLATARGLDAAVLALSKFWRHSEVRAERVRPVDGLEVEVYEAVRTPRGETLPIVSLLRREAPAAPWKVVCTTETRDERLVLWVPTAEAAVDHAAWAAGYLDAFGEACELRVDGDAAALRRPSVDGLAHLRGPFLPDPWPSILPRRRRDTGVVELRLRLEPDDATRAGQLAWALRGADVTATLLGAEAVYLPAHQKLILADALWQAAREPPTPAEAFRLWARLEQVRGHYLTTGLRLLGCPELEASRHLADEALVRRLVIWMGQRLLAGEVPAVGTELLAGEGVFQIAAGRRGPLAGLSYGRWGSLALVPRDGRAQGGERRRLRMPEPAGHREWS
jgi:hypothetical protein